MSVGYDKLLAAVKKDIEESREQAARGIHFRSEKEYQEKFDWAIGRAKEYGSALNLNWEDILDSWEEDRRYWYMNYYQECNQPAIVSKRTRVFDTVEDMLKSVGELRFRCPACGGISTDPYECNSGNTVGGKTCNWKLYGFLGNLVKGVFIYCKDKLKGQNIFMPISWEEDK